jgi:mRNA interferase RelE/StbE
MAPYRVQFKPSVGKDLRRLPPDVLRRVMARIAALENDPLPRQVTRLSGAERLYRLRVGDYRIIYEVDTESRQVTVHYVRHRQDAYRQM